MITKIVVIPVGLALPNIDIIFENSMTDSNKLASLLFHSISGCKSSEYTISLNPTLLDTLVILGTLLQNFFVGSLLIFVLS